MKRTFFLALLLAGAACSTGCVGTMMVRGGWRDSWGLPRFYPTAAMDLRVFSTGGNPSGHNDGPAGVRMLMSLYCLGEFPVSAVIDTFCVPFDASRPAPESDSPKDSTGKRPQPPSKASPERTSPP